MEYILLPHLLIQNHCKFKSNFIRVKIIKFNLQNYMYCFYYNIKDRQMLVNQMMRLEFKISDSITGSQTLAEL